MKKLPVKKILLAIVLILVVIQFLPMSKNEGQAWGANDVSTVITTSAEVKQVLDVACNDCHSNHTTYPWYTNVQPFGFWINHHVDEGKHHLNFSEFATYKTKRKLHKLDEVVEMMQEGEMPLSSYTLIHKEAKLNAAQVQLIVDWAKQGKDKIIADSLALIK